MGLLTICDPICTLDYTVDSVVRFHLLAKHGYIGVCEECGILCICSFPISPHHFKRRVEIKLGYRRGQNGGGYEESV